MQITRSEARAAAVQLLYEWEMGGDGGDDTRTGLLELSPDAQGLAYTEALVSGVQEHCAELDAVISGRLKPGWRLERIARVDLTILRLGIYELTYEAELPTGVVINEAAELAKLFSTEESVSFVNGLLAAVARSGRTV